MWAALWTGLVSIFTTFFKFVLPEVFFKAMLAIGLTVVTMPAIDYLLSEFKDEIYTQLLGLPGDVALMLGLLRLDDAIEVVFSAYFYRYALTRLAPGRIAIRSAP